LFVIHNLLIAQPANGTEALCGKALRILDS